MKIKRFEELPIWKLALELTKVIYDFTAQPKFSKDFVLRDQIRRAVISISSNIVEGFEKNNNNEFIRYLKISKGSVGEVRNQLLIALTIGYISQTQFDKTNQRLEDLAGQIGGLISYLEKCRLEGKFNIKKLTHSRIKSVNPLIRNGIIKKPITKILAILLIIGLNWIGFSAVIGTFAYFSDTETAGQNIYSAGSLDFQVDLKKEDNRFQTYTQGGWGSAAHGNNPGAYRDANFDGAFPSGVSIGDSVGYEALFTTSEAVENFLPAGGTPMPFTGNHVDDPVSTEAGVLAGQVLALTLNVGFDLNDPNFALSVNNLSDYVISDSSVPIVPCNGMTVQGVLDEANTILGGLPGSFSASDINECAAWINEKFEDGGTVGGLSPGGSFSQFATITNVGSLDFQYTARIEKTSGDDDFCNALNLEALLEGATHYAGNLMTFVSSPVVYSFSADEWEFIISLPADASAEGSCGFDFVFEGWQTNLEGFGGFSDIERIDDPIHSAVSVTVNSDDSGDTDIAAYESLEPLLVGIDGSIQAPQFIPEQEESQPVPADPVITEPIVENISTTTEEVITTEETVVTEQATTTEELPIVVEETIIVEPPQPDLEASVDAPAEPAILTEPVIIEPPVEPVLPPADPPAPTE